MPPSEKFKLAIVGCLGFLISFFLIWAVVLGGPLPILRTKEFTPSENIPTFEDSAAETKTIAELWEGGYFAEDEKTGKLRANVLSTLEVYRSEPCNMDFKEKYIESVIEFIEDRMDRMSDSGRDPSDSTEVAEIDGKIMDSSLKFDEEALSAIIASAGEGLLFRQDIPGKMAILIGAGEEDAGGAENIYKACNNNPE